MNKVLPKIVVICGPTGSGKTSLAVSLCKKFNGEIINADSRQVYKEMDIGTGKDLDQISVPIHLIDILKPNQKYNVGRYKKDAEKVIKDILTRGKVPFLVGGTGMYIDAVVDNFQLPVGAGLASAQNKWQLQKLPLQDLIKQLEKLDPDALNIVDLKNRRRVERAIEVCLNTGIPFTKQRSRGKRKYEVLKLSPAVSLEREKLYEKIGKRVDEMIGQGLEKEVEILAKKYGWESEAMTGIGYREWQEYFVGTGLAPAQDKGQPQGLPLQNVIEKIKQDTRNYAKRQITWFKRDKEINHVDLKKAEKMVKEF